MVPHRCAFSVWLTLLAHDALSYAATIPQEVFEIKPLVGSIGAVACEAKECSEIGKQILQKGGNAVDAMVATTFCVGVIAPYHSGIGGGGFAMVRDSAGNYEAIDFREAAPLAAHENMYEGNINGSIFGGLAAGVPSELRGLEHMHVKYGSLSWESLMQPAIQVARDGFIVSADLIGYIQKSVNDHENFLVNDPAWAEDFAPHGIIVKQGDRMTRLRYSRTLETIAKEGADAFYTGPLASSWIETVQAHNGTMTLQDLRDYKVISRPVSKIDYRGLALYGIGSPAGGAVALGILKTMEQYNPADWSDSNLTLHRFDEAMRFAFAARLQLGDPSFVEGVEAFESKMLESAAARTIKQKISDEHTYPVDYYNPEGIYTSDSHGTSHIVTADRSGMAATLTTTVNLLFGARLVDMQTGVIVNNEMNDFSIPRVRNEFGFEPSEANFIRPKKRPLSSCTPIIAAFPDGSLSIVIGAAGGSRIISSTAQTLWHILDHNMTTAEALRQPRLHDQLMPNYIMVEYAFDNSTVASLEERGHNITWVRPGLSAVQGIRVIEDGFFEAASEPRQPNSGIGVA